MVRSDGEPWRRPTFVEEFLVLELVVVARQLEVLEGLFSSQQGLGQGGEFALVMLQHVLGEVRLVLQVLNGPSQDKAVQVSGPDDAQLGDGVGLGVVDVHLLLAEHVGGVGSEVVGFQLDHSLKSEARK